MSMSIIFGASSIRIHLAPLLLPVEKNCLFLVGSPRGLHPPDRSFPNLLAPWVPGTLVTQKYFHFGFIARGALATSSNAAQSSSCGTETKKSFRS